MNFNLDCFEFILKWLARPLRGPKGFYLQAKVAAYSVAESLMAFINEGIATDINELKDLSLQKIQAEADKLTAEAQEASNKATIHKRRDKFAQLEKEFKQAEIEKTKAEAEAIERDSETLRLQVMADAKIRFIEAVSRLRQEGGDLILDSKNLEDILSNNLDIKIIPPTVSVGTKVVPEKVDKKE